MAMVFLMGYRWLDFSPKDDPNRKIKGYNVFLGIPDRDVTGIVPAGDGGKRFIGEALAQRLKIDDQFFDDNLYDFINVDIDFNGKICGCSALTDEQKQSADYPFSALAVTGSSEDGEAASKKKSTRYPF